MERFRNVVALAHSCWASIVKKGDYVIGKPYRPKISHVKCTKIYELIILTFNS
jgi:hypothetical protein